MNIEINVDTSCQNTFSDNSKQNWGKLSSESLLNLSNDINWEYTVCGLSVENMWEELHGKLMDISANVPISKPVYNAKGDIVQKQPWDCTSLKRKRRNKDKFWKIFDNQPTASNLNIALSKQREYEKSEIGCKINYENRITKNLKGNTKSFFSYIRSKRTINTTVTSLNKCDGSKTGNCKDTADLLADNFSSVFLSETFGPLPEKCYKVLDPPKTIGDVCITDDDIFEELNNLNIYKSFGPDKIHPKLLKSLAPNNEFIKALGDLMRNCAASGQIPKAWKEANVVPLHKSGSRCDAGNYRPVSLTCILCKIYERFIRKHILSHVENHISQHQHGFVGGKSCASNLLETIDIINDLLEAGAPVDILYFDFSKAFDTVPHYRLLTKLESFGITGITLDIIRNFLSNRVMRVVVGGVESEIKYVKSGVPQGSVLGPLLFVLFINDLPEGVKSGLKLFADDLKLMANANIFTDIQEDIRLLEEWQNLWLLNFNPSKCKVLHINKNSNPLNRYYLDEVELKSVNTERDLGVLTSNSFTWNENINNAINKANSTIAWISRSIINRSEPVMMLIYKSLIRPHIEYCVQVWNPVPQRGTWDTILAIENVQRRFTRLIDGIGLLTYRERLQKLKLTTLAERRARGDLIETYKIISGSVNYGSNLFKLSRSGVNIVSTSGVNGCNRELFKERVIRMWNSLPLFVKISKSVENFKINLDKHKRTSINVGQNYWDVSEELLGKIESVTSDSSRNNYVEFMRDNPWVAKRRGINVRVPL